MSSNNVQSEKGTQSREGETSPLVSVGLPTYNREATLPRALDSLLNQTYQNIELIISDNASTDRTYDICQAYLKKDARIRYYRNDTNIGLVGNGNRVFHLSKGKYFMWANDDDEWSHDFIERNVIVLENNSILVLSYTGFTFVGYRNNTIVLAPTPRTISDSLLTRAKEVVEYALRGLGPGIAICGVIRSDFIRRTTLLHSCYGPDIVLLLELAFLGPFNLIAKPMLKKSKPSDRRNDIRKQSIYFPGYTGSFFQRIYYNIAIIPLMVKVVMHSNVSIFHKFQLLCPIMHLFLRLYFPRVFWQEVAAVKAKIGYFVTRKNTS